jgi:hypothetical protein
MFQLSYRKSKHTFTFNFVFRKSYCVLYKVEKFCRAGQDPNDNIAHAHCMLDNPKSKYIHERALMSRSKYINIRPAFFLIQTFISHHREHSVIPLERTVHLFTLRILQVI